MKSHGPWKIKKRTLKYTNPWIKVYEDKVVRPDGKKGIHVFIDLKKGAAVLPIDEQGYVYLTREFHYGIGEYTLEVMGGGIEDKETPLAAAQRELKEELGITAKNGCPWDQLIVSPPICIAGLGCSSPEDYHLAPKILKAAKRPK